MSTTDLNDQQIKELLEGITQGEWRRDMHGKFVGVKTADGKDVIGWNGFDSSDFPVVRQKANARFIAAAPALVAQLQRQLAAAQARIQELEEQREAEAMDAWGDNFDRGL